MFRYWLFIVFLITEIRLQAQQLQSSMFDLYTKEDGLSDDMVKGMVQDSAGFLWIGTAWGLNRFDGHRFIQYYSDNDSASMPTDDVFDMTRMDDHQVGIYGTGLHIINTRTGGRRNLFIPYHDKKYQFKFNMVMNVTSGSNGDLFVLTRSGFYHFNNQYQLLYRFDYYTGEQVAVEHFIFGAAILEVDSHRLLIVSSNGLYVYDKGRRQFEKASAAAFPLLADAMSYPNPPLEFFQKSVGEFIIFKTDSDSVVYVDLNRNLRTTSKVPIDLSGEIAWRSKLLQVNDSLFYINAQLSGIYYFMLDNKTGRIQFNPLKQLPEYACSRVMIDRQNRLLVATNKGLLRQRAYEKPVETARIPAGMLQQFPKLWVNYVAVTNDKVYAATRGAGLAVFNKKSFAFEKNIFFSQLGTSADKLVALTKVDENTFFIGALGIPVLYNTVQQTATKIIPPKWNTEYDWTMAQLNDGRGNIWISAANIYRWNIASKQFSIIPQLPQLLSAAAVSATDSAGNIWFVRHGIARYNISLGKYDVYIDSFPFIKIPDKQAKALAVDKKNRIWFSSINNGLILYDPVDKTFRHFTRNDGLPDNSVYAITAVNNKVWAGCYSGIACVDINDFAVTGFGKENGFPNSNIEQGSRFYYDTPSQKLYIGFKDAVVRFNPDQLLQKKIPPRVFIESVVANGKTLFYLPRQGLSTSWSNKELTVSIGSINFFDGATQRYAYRMDGNDSMPWTDLGQQASFSVSNLSPGHHRLQVKVYSISNRWPPQVRELEITVAPPFWLQTWFIVAVLLLLTGLIYNMVRWRASAARKKEMVNTQMQKLRAEDYKAQFELEQVSNYFSSSLTDKKDEEAVLWDVAANLIGRMNYEDCVIYLWNRDKSKMVQKAAYGPKGRPEVILKDAFEVAPGQGIVGQVMATAKPLLVNDTRKDARYRMDDEFRLSELAVPIIHNDELLGIIDSENSRVNYFSERDIKMLTTIATLIANKLKQIESERSLEAKQQELTGINEQLAEARLSALQTQMNPHFVFNALNSIKRMILDADNEKASRYLSKFALMIRMTLEHSKETFVTLQDNIQYLKAYLEMEKLRFDDRFVYSIVTAEEADASETMLPSMMIQPLVENAIWHGLMYAAHEKKLLIAFDLQEQRVVCIIEDNGIGIRQSEQLRQQQRPMHRSVGLGNLQNRIKIMNEKYHTECRLEITDLKQAGLADSGTRAVLSFNQIKI